MDESRPGGFSSAEGKFDIFRRRAILISRLCISSESPPQGELPSTERPEGFYFSRPQTRMPARCFCNSLFRLLATAVTFSSSPLRYSAINQE